MFEQIIKLTLEPLSAHDVTHQESSVAVNIFLKATLKSRVRPLRVIKNFSSQAGQGASPLTISDVRGGLVG